MRWPILIILTLMIAIPTIHAQIDVEPVNDLKPILQPSITKIKLVQYIGSTDELPFAHFEIRNIGKASTQNLDIFFTKLVNTAEIRYVGNTNSHIFSGLELKGKPTEIPKNDTETIRYHLVEPFSEEGTYVGQIKISGDNFDTISLDVEIESKIHPRYLLITTIGGIVSALVIGYSVSYKGKKDLVEKSPENESEILTSLNNQIKEWNMLSDSINKIAWTRLINLASERANSINIHMSKKYLTKDNEDVKWFKTIAPSLFVASLAGAGYNNNPITINFVSSTRDSDFKQKQYKTATKDLKNPKKVLYFASTIIISLPTTLFVSDTFVGWIPFNLVIAFSTGFAIYKIQSIRDLLFKKE